MTTPKAKLAGLALIAALCGGFTSGLTAPAWADFNAGVAAYKQGDYATALREFRPLAERGDAEAQYTLGLMYRKGQGVAQDDADAVKWYRKAAEQGDAEAQHNLGFMYGEGLGVPKDYAEAVGWYRKAAEQGFASAQAVLGVLYAVGRVVRQDYAEAVKWYRKAAEQGDAESQHNLGFMYERGLGVTQDDAKAVKWYRKAAEQGHAASQAGLGFMYALGEGVPQDFVKAYMWLKIAASRLPPGEWRDKVVKVRDNFAKMLTPAQISEAKKLAQISEAKKLAREADLDASILFAQERGLEIYERDRAAWQATDAGFAVGLSQTKARGWITIPTDQGWLVRFVAYCEERPCSVLDVRLDGERVKASLVDPPAPLSSREQNAWRARQLALSTEFRRCSRRYNTVVIPPRGQYPEWTVYLLAATDDPNAVILAGHHRVTISSDGTEVRKSEALSKSCLLSQRNPDAAAMFVTHVLDPYPIETHVFTSLNYQLSIYVNTNIGTFAVEGAAIRKVE